jgi:hypothetical protein
MIVEKSNKECRSAIFTMSTVDQLLFLTIVTIILPSNASFIGHSHYYYYYYWSFTLIRQSGTAISAKMLKKMLSLAVSKFLDEQELLLYVILFWDEQNFVCQFNSRIVVFSV